MEKVLTLEERFKFGFGQAWEHRTWGYMRNQVKELERHTTSWFSLFVRIKFSTGKGLFTFQYDNLIILLVKECLIEKIKWQIPHSRTFFLFNYWTGLLKNTTHWAVIMNTPYSLAQEVCYRQDSQLWKIVLLQHWNGISNDHLLKQTAWQPLYSRRAVHTGKKNGNKKTSEWQTDPWIQIQKPLSWKLLLVS